MLELAILHVRIYKGKIASGEGDYEYNAKALAYWEGILNKESKPKKSPFYVNRNLY